MAVVAVVAVARRIPGAVVAVVVVGVAVAVVVVLAAAVAVNNCPGDVVQR